MDEDQDEEAVEWRRKRAQEILRLREDVGAARDAQIRKDAKREAARRKEEVMRRVLLGEGDAAPSGGGERKQSIGDEGDEDDDENNYFDDAEGGMVELNYHLFLRGISTS